MLIIIFIASCSVIFYNNVKDTRIHVSENRLKKAESMMEQRINKIKSEQILKTKNWIYVPDSSNDYTSVFRCLKCGTDYNFDILSNPDEMDCHNCESIKQRRIK